MNSSANLRGAALMVAAMAAFTVNDAFVKSVTGEMNTGQIMFIRGLMTTALIVSIAWWVGAMSSLRAMLQPAFMLRLGAEITASVTYIAALGMMPLANTSSILQALPLAVTLGAALFLGEKVGWRRWLAIATGFLGVMIVIRPGAAGFSLASIYVVVSVVGAATRDLCTRRIDPTVSSLFISAVTAAAITLVGGFLIVPMGGWQPVEPSALARLAGAAGMLLVGYQTIVLAMRHGDISFIAPLRYTSLIWAIGIGVVAFGELPDLWTIIGVVIIVLSGLYTFYRENRRRSATIAQDAIPESP
ncbi:MAG: DMT family transporter [Shinella sp.]|nr:DMT family transporter [Shinella sp.]